MNVFQKVLAILKFLILKVYYLQRLETKGWSIFALSARFRIFGKLSLGNRISISPYSYIDIKGKASIGQNSNFNDGFRLVCRESVHIGSHVLVASNVAVYDHDHDYQLKGGHLNFSGYTTQPVVIGDHVWIGDQTVILKGVTIGSNSIIGAGSVVTGSIPSNVVAAGNPCKVIRMIE